jgi:hypothetical protein
LCCRRHNPAHDKLLLRAAHTHTVANPDILAVRQISADDHLVVFAGKQFTERHAARLVGEDVVCQRVCLWIDIECVDELWPARCHRVEFRQL